jgi:hypothetical protein
VHHRISEGSTDLAFVGILDGDPPHRRRLLLRLRIGLVRVNHTALDEREVARPVRARIPERGLGERCLGVDVEARQRDGERVAVAAEFVHRDLERCGRRLTAGAGQAHSISPDLLELDRVESGGDVGAQILGAADLVQQL